jgi:hypothetical protein
MKRQSKANQYGWPNQKNIGPLCRMTARILDFKGSRGWIIQIGAWRMAHSHWKYLRNAKFCADPGFLI